MNLIPCWLAHLVFEGSIRKKKMLNNVATKSSHMKSVHFNLPEKLLLVTELSKSFDMFGASGSLNDLNKWATFF